MDGKYIRFHVIEKKEKTKVYGVFTLTDDLIGTIRWYPRWRQYSFFPDKETVWNNGCLRDLQNFIYQITKEHKEAKGRSPP
ncbi:MAG: hypothetical protein KGH62_06130, partial [Candidatus Micrarchaeota archaeon]|nr:hypothetical protein [Candidatus Micrarchaeota archaeon]